MENRRRRTARASTLLGLCWCASLFAATGTPRGATVLWSGEDQWVRIERQDDAAAAPNDHPAALDAATVADALAALRVRPSDSADAAFERPAFAKEELARLAPQIAAGLSRAGPRQDVTFSTIGSHPLGSYSLLKDPSVNAGRVFYRDGRLNVIFGELQANYRKKNVYGRRDQDFEPRRVGSRARASRHEWALATAPGIELHAANPGGVRADWVIIDPAVARPQPAPTAAARAPEAAAAPTAAPAPEAPAASGPAATPAASEGTDRRQPGPDLERRLEVLKDLRDKGLISEQAYEEKVRQLLSEL